MVSNVPRLNLRRSAIHLSRLLFGCLLTFSWLAPPAKAGTLEVVGPTDFYFEFSEPIVFQARAYAIQYGIDSMLWLYNSQDQVVTANDDWFGLDSWIETSLPAGTYRLRAGVCCGDPNRWYGTSYQIEFNTQPVDPTTTTSTLAETTTTVEETTTTLEATTTTEEPTTTIQETTTTSEPEPTTTIEETTTTIVPETSTTTLVPETTWPASTNPTTTVSITVPKPTAPATTKAPPSTTSTSSSEPSTTNPPLETSSPSSSEPSITSVDDTSTNTGLPSEPPQSPTEPPEGTDSPEVPSTPNDPSDDSPETATSSSTSTTLLIVAPSNDASEEAKQEFEQTVNVFDGSFDNYIPAGSNVTVAQRRTIIAVTAATTLLAPMTTIRRRGK